MEIIWFAHYVFHPPALACFLIGVFGLLSVEIQLLAIGPIQHKYEQQASASVSDFSNLIATSVNASMYNDSATYAGQVNARVDAIQSSINDGLFGWVNSTTTTLNETVNTFYSDVQNLVNTVFGNTILNDPVVFPSPETFDPARFLPGAPHAAEARKLVDFAFGWGRRVCPGKPMGEANVFIGAAMLAATVTVRGARAPDGAPLDPRTHWSSGTFRCASGDAGPGS